MTKSPFIFGAPHLTVEEWQDLFKKLIKNLEISLLTTTSYTFKERQNIARDIITFTFFIDALPTILKEG